MITVYRHVIADNETEEKVAIEWMKCEYKGFVETFLGQGVKKESFYPDVSAMAQRGTSTEEKVLKMPPLFQEALKDIKDFGL